MSMVVPISAARPGALEQNFLRAFTTGAEKFGCPTASTPCTPPLSPLTFQLAPVGGAFVEQRVTFVGWAGFVGQEQANIRIAPGTPSGEKRLRATVPSRLNLFGSDQRLVVNLGPTN